MNAARPGPEAATSDGEEQTEGESHPFRLKRIIDLRKKIAPIPEVGARPQIEQTPSGLGNAISWSGPLTYHEPDMRLVWVVTVILFALAALAQIYQRNVITTVFFGLLGVMILVQTKKKPVIGQVEIGPLGVKINEQIHGYRDLKSFWVDYQPHRGIKELSLQSRKWYLPYIKIPIGDQNPIKIRAFLIGFIPEIEHQETLADALGRRLGL